MKQTCILFMMMLLFGCVTHAPRDDAHALRASVESGRYRSLERLLKRGTDPDLRSDDLTALCVAPNVKIAQLLIDHGADINAYCQGGTVPVHTSNPDIAKLLIKLGADIGPLGRDRRTPLHNVAASLEHWKVDTTALLLVFLEAGVDVNAKTRSGEITALHSAAGWGRVEDIKLLLRHGADINVVAGMGFTPLDAAQEGGHVLAAELLRQNGGKNNRYRANKELKAKDESAP